MDASRKRAQLAELRSRLDALRRANAEASREKRKTIAADTMRLTEKMLDLIDELLAGSDPPQSTKRS
jgi:hypothetical protein